MEADDMTTRPQDPVDPETAETNIRETLEVLWPAALEASEQGLVREEEELLAVCTWMLSLGAGASLMGSWQRTFEDARDQGRIRRGSTYIATVAGTRFYSDRISAYLEMAERPADGIHIPDASFSARIASADELRSSGVTGISADALEAALRASGDQVRQFLAVSLPSENWSVLYPLVDGDELRNAQAVVAAFPGTGESVDEDTRPPDTDAPDAAAELEEMAALKDQGLLSEEEFAEVKARLLDELGG